MAFTAQTPSSAAAWRPDQFTFHAADVIPEALVLQASTVSGSVDGDAPAVRVAYVDDDAATFIAEASEIPESEPGLSECVIYTGKISQLIRVSQEQFGQPETATQLSQSVARALVKKADSAFVNQVAPTPPANQPAAGLLNVADIVAGGEISGDLDGLVDLVAAIQGNQGMPTHIIVDPASWAELRKLKVASEWNQSLLGAGTADAVPMLLGLPLLVNIGMPAYTGLVVDRAAVVSAVGPIKVSTSEDVYFATDDVGLKATWRIGQNVVRPNRIGKFTVAEPGS